jgi:hypothetical protein
MTAQNPKSHIKCPFWSARPRKCTIRGSGLFIPLDDHVEAFCKTSHFSACTQYTLHSEYQIGLLAKVRKTEANRRKYMRIATSHNITVVKIFKSKQLESQFSYAAKTIDISKSGLRVAIRNPLIHDTMVHCSFDDSFPQALHEVTGHVKWCNKQVDEPGYQVGLSFMGDHVVEAIEAFLSQQNNQR